MMFIMDFTTDVHNGLNFYQDEQEDNISLIVNENVRNKSYLSTGVPNSRFEKSIECLRFL